MVIDTSAVLAILLDERDAATFARAIENAGDRRMSAAGYLEVTLEQGRIARAAYRDFGKVRHRAGLNFGDCFAYALARILDQPLLYKGRDFNHTDLQSALKQ
jgi:ribonuclease VapC